MKPLDVLLAIIGVVIFLAVFGAFQVVDQMDRIRSDFITSSETRP